MLIYVSILPFVREEKNKRITSQSFTVRLRHFTKKSVLLPPFYTQGNGSNERQSGLLKDSALAKMLSVGFHFTACPL